MSVSSLLQAQGTLFQLKDTPVHIGYEAGCVPEQVWAQQSTENIFPLPGIEPRPSNL
jgi:hypothetical protein